MQSEQDRTRRSCCSHKPLSASHLREAVSKDENVLSVTVKDPKKTVAGMFTQISNCLITYAGGHSEQQNIFSSL